MAKVWKVVAFGDPNRNGFRYGIALADTAEKAVELANDPTTVAFEIRQPTRLPKVGTALSGSTTNANALNLPPSPSAKYSAH